MKRSERKHGPSSRVRTGLLSSILVALSLWVVAAPAGRVPGVGDPAPDIQGKPWINSLPLTLGDLHGQVVLVSFWTYG